MQISVFTDLKSVGEFWPRLDSPEGPHFYAFQSQEVMGIWLETIGAARGTQPFFVCVSSADGTPLMLLPLGIERRKGINILGFLDGGVCDYNAPILFPGADSIDAECMRLIWREIVARLPRCDAAVFEKIPVKVEEVSNPFQALAPTQDDHSGHILHLKPASVDKPPRFNDTSRKWRKLRTAATTAFVIASTPADISRILDQLILQKTRRYLETRGINGFDRPGYRSYFRTMTERLGNSGTIHLSAIFANDQAIATHWGLVARKRFYFLMPTFESGDWAKYSPGLLHLEEMIAWSCKNGIDTFDLGVGDMAYKLRISNDVLPLRRGHQAYTSIGHTYVAALAARRSIGAGPIGDAWRAIRRKRYELLKQ